MLKKVLVASALLATIINANASSSAFGVTGTITPEACNVTLTGGTVNLGSINASVVKGYGLAQTSYAMPSVAVPISIVCSAPTKVEVSFVDNKVGKVFAIDTNDPIRYGMVDGAGTAAIGSIAINFNNTVIDTVAVGQFLNAPNNTTTWTATGPSNLSAIFASPGYTIGFAKLASATTPDSFTTLAGNLIMSPYISAAYVKGATAAITPTSSGTLTLVYL
ncbi:DUF1120 domain-containing protein [Glaciimonas immobilis]|uniref:DUF1120 domain-containing protein n=1 Tax=Glaciimonas immobilis TaxID=728004 RepID=A0A840RKI0_9BURK|nr:DUF1120 domain-containing protein [Glaciimonas immobilis]KAF3999263.1 DUF1120 domain-containing protein [Glaciimonas immobilis]MBB5198727.1 hypothetical protein [Glaciimonas immobilis]MBB5198728.1 hypothetical protein [Glaciimonas immobilis]